MLGGLLCGSVGPGCGDTGYGAFYVAVLWPGNEDMGACHIAGLQPGVRKCVVLNYSFGAGGGGYGGLFCGHTGMELGRRGRDTGA